MAKKIYLFIAIALLSSTFLTAQTAEKCATDYLLKSAIQKDPSLLQKMAVSEAKLQAYMNAHANEKSGVVYTIPIVIHIIHNGEPIGEGTNISDEQIQSQIDRLNEDFRKTNADSLGADHPYYPIQADAEIEFCLAQRDPEGNATTGIYRYNLQQPGWDRTSIDSFIKPLTIWNRYDYMNIWSINIDDPNSPGVDGYGTFPASTTDSTDGLVIAYTSFGTVNGEKFITGTHEVGHYLNLHHVWGDNQPNCGDDLVDDTPPSAEPNFGCPDFPHNPNDSCGTGPNGDIFMNFMDYADAVCTVMFTTGQKDRMRATLETERASLLVSNGCTPVDADGDGYAVNDDCDDTNATVYPSAPELCDGLDNDCDGIIPPNESTLDNDGDGFSSCQGDCDDTNAAINPAATEVCDGADNNCDGTTNEGFPLITYYIDADGDGIGTSGVWVSSCAPVPGYVTVNGDCDDSNAATYPGAVEVCDGLDNNCDGNADEGFTLTTYYLDTDGDGYGTDAFLVSSCAPVPGYVTVSGDCDDSNAAANPDATEVCDGADNNCDGSIDEGFPLTTYYIDLDSDGYGTSAVWVSSCAPVPGYVTINGDCDDSNAAINPAATEVCDGADNNCDGTANEGFPLTTYYIDADSDGYGTSVVWVSSCAPVPGYVTISGDCDDSDAAVNPAATEVCDGADNNCNSTTDEGLTSTFYADADGDGFGNAAVSDIACSATTGFVANSTDCDDTNAAANPDATEVCDGADNNCDGTTDEGLTFTTYYIDTDGDGIGTSAVWVSSCSPVAGYVTINGDCNDADATTFPGATEVCDGADNNCDGTADEGLVTTIYYVDMDGDGFGNAAVSMSSCAPVVGFVTVSGDCNDTNATANPAATEVCDAADNDCDGTTDEGVTSTFYADADGDGFGNAAVTDIACSATTGFVANSTDCDDTNASTNPAAMEVCDAADNDCDGTTDEGVTSTFYADADGDGFGNAAVTGVACSAPTGFVANGTDCDDANAAIHPSATEVCDGLDNNCDGTVPANELDGDNDSFAACEDDCNDADASIYPGATEIANNGIDEDCDGEDLISGVNDPSLEQLLTVTPNPFSTSLNLRCDCNVSLHYTLYDQLGRTLNVGSVEMNHGTVEIKTPGLTPGMYYLSITDEAGKAFFVKRLVNIE